MLLTCVFQETLQRGLNTSQQISTHVLKLAPYTRKFRTKEDCFHG